MHIDIWDIIYSGIKLIRNFIILPFLILPLLVLMCFQNSSLGSYNLITNPKVICTISGQAFIFVMNPFSESLSGLLLMPLLAAWHSYILKGLNLILHFMFFSLTQDYFRKSSVFQAFPVLHYNITFKKCIQGYFRKIKLYSYIFIRQNKELTLTWGDLREQGFQTLKKMPFNFNIFLW